VDRNDGGIELSIEREERRVELTDRFQNFLSLLSNLTEGRSVPERDGYGYVLSQQEENRS